ncbi:MAG: hypothetical protein O2U61_04565 [Candidatus Bathyarchaeota archaeon]|nr:hypothetical protein [Candidatus Bathyarchaeota archaeon]
MMLTIAILVSLIIISLPLGINFYRTRQLDTHENGVVQVLRRAQLKSRSIDDDSSFGVYITTDRYILFKGSSYSDRDPTYDEVSDIPGGFIISGISEVVFSKFQGLPSTTGSIILTTDTKSETIYINEVGNINY